MIYMTRVCRRIERGTASDPSEGYGVELSLGAAHDSAYDSDDVIRHNVEGESTVRID